MSEQRRFGTAGTLSAILIQAGSRDAQVNPTLAPGDVQVSKDGVAFANIATLPSVFPAGSVRVNIILSASELSCRMLMIRFKDQAGAEWEEQTILVETYGHPDAEHYNIGANPTLSAEETRDAMDLVTGAHPDTIDAQLSAIDVKIDTVDTEVGIIDGKVDGIQTDTTQIISDVGTVDGKVDTTNSALVVIDGKADDILTDIASLAASAALEATSQAILAAVGAIIAKLPSTGLISNFYPNSSTVDGITYDYIFEVIASFVNGRYALDTPGPCDITFYKRDNLTPLTIVHVAQSGRTRLS